MKQITAKENIQLTEVYRRLHAFHKGNVNDTLIMLAMPSEVKTLVEKKILVCAYKETAKVLNWYNLAEKGKTLMQIVPPMKEKENLLIFEGKMSVEFNYFLKLTGSKQLQNI